MFSRISVVCAAVPWFRRLEKRISQFRPFAVDCKCSNGHWRVRPAHRISSTFARISPAHHLPVSSCGPVERVAPNMKRHPPSRLCLGAAFVVLGAIAPAFARGGGQKQKAAPPPAMRQNNRPAQPRVNGPNTGVRTAQNQEPHMEQWMENHKNLSPADQRRAMQNEPGFRELPPQTQQRILNHLDQLNSVKPQLRDRTLQQNEILEHMPPAQAQQYRAAAQTFATLPQDRRRLMRS